MKADPSLRQLPVLFLTAQTSGAEAARGLLLGAHDYLKKPCAKAELLARVSAALRQTAHEQRLASHAQELEELSTTDPLTGVGNRRHLEQGLALLPKSRPLDVLMADLDRFKQVNDTRGHVVGDAVLAIVAARLWAGCGPEAIIARWGGEEFVIAVPDATPESLSELGERLRAAVANDPLVVGDVEPLQVTISIGGATGRAGEFVVLLGVADTALYDAKDAGRNQVRTGTLPAR
ncbi:MAG TPA: diguanylate cyclase [Motilibacterales bacterium]|nr:diguanylate cyclase [Motilibacterales bacterium]